VVNNLTQQLFGATVAADTPSVCTSKVTVPVVQDHQSPGRGRTEQVVLANGQTSYTACTEAAELIVARRSINEAAGSVAVVFWCTAQHSTQGYIMEAMVQQP
jgi:hypothetical protein